MPITVRSRAKINLGLRIGARRKDGFHELLTIYQTLALHDVLRVSVVRGRGIEIRCADPRVPKDESNTCFRIADGAMQAVGTNGRVVIEIEKRLPVQGGLGGASSNAVATLLGLERALRKRLSATEKMRLAAEVGSDLPLFLLGGTVLGVGRGEQVYPLQDLSPMSCVIVTPEIGVSTPKAFEKWDRLCGAGTPARAKLGTVQTLNEKQDAGRAEPYPTGRVGITRATQAGAAVSSKLTVQHPSDRMNELRRGFSAWLSELYSGAPFRGRAENPLLELVRAGIANDFEEVVFPEYPELREVKSALERAGANYASLSGSGSALYGLFDSRQSAVRAAGTLRKRGWSAQATVTLPRRQYWKKIFD